jgi:hypothetical protein
MGHINGGNDRILKLLHPDRLSGDTFVSKVNSNILLVENTGRLDKWQQLSSTSVGM